MRNNLRNHSDISKRYYENPTSTIIISNISVLSSYIPYPIIHLPQRTTLTFHPPQERLTPINNNSLTSFTLPLSPNRYRVSATTTQMANMLGHPFHRTRTRVCGVDHPLHELSLEYNSVEWVIERLLNTGPDALTVVVLGALSRPEFRKGERDIKVPLPGTRKVFLSNSLCCSG
ncbi:hypothetical protein TNCV_933411 [Trichonephila clavipes]|nr:hypothetical protein TNCV_933411 [Trichonephila clavipes]